MEQERETLVVRYAERSELEAVNALRKQVNDVHIAGRGDIFRADAWGHIKDIVYTRFDEDESGIIVAVLDGEIVGYAQVQYIVKPLSPGMCERKFYHIEEFGVDESHRRMGIATALMQFVKGDAKEKSFSRIELNMWEFNEGALAFYESIGFVTFRRYMECEVV